jgi:exoribonuclease-2
MFLEGQIIEFLDDDQLKVGYVRKQERDRLQVVDPRGRHISIAGDRVVVVHQKTSEDGFPGFARELSEKIQIRQVEMDVELLWDSLGGNQREFTPAELAALFFSESSPEAVSAVFRSLSADTLYFRRKGTQFLPRTADQVGTERTRRDRQLEHEQARGTLAESLNRLLHGKAIEMTPDVSALVDRIQNWMRQTNGDPAGTLLEELAGPARARDAAYDILRRAGRVDPRQDRFLVMAGINEAFPPAVESAASALLPHQHESTRIDYRDAPAFTIDDDDTLEVDDAITLKQEGDTITVGIHIADVTAFVAKGDMLDVEASARSSTIYLPANTVRMFPDRLSTDLASLRQGEDRPAFTVEVQFDASGVSGNRFNRLGYRIVLGTIRVNRRLSYESADKLIQNDGDSDLKILHSIALHLQQERASRGAITVRRPEFQIHVDESGIHVGKLDPNSPSRLLVSEMMILSNGLAADFASAHSVPVIYRTQESRDASAPAETTAMDPIAFEKLRKSFKRSRLSLTPGPHSGLGLSAYTQASSPIRRYADLVTQQQFTAFLRGKPVPYDREELLGILANAETTEQEVRGIEDRSTNYWILEYLSREKIGQPMNAVVLDRKGNIELEECYLRGRLHIAASTGASGNDEPGSVISVMIDTIHPDKGEVRFKRA